jgi:hypothetical protein
MFEPTDREKRLPKWAKDLIAGLRQEISKSKTEKCSNCNCIHCGERFVVGMADHLVKCSHNTYKIEEDKDRNE